MSAAGGYAARNAVGVKPNVRRKVSVNEPTLLRPTDMQMSVTVQSVGAQQGRRALEAASQEVDVGRYPERAPERDAEVRPGQGRRFGHVVDGQGIAVASVDQVARPGQESLRRRRRHDPGPAVAADGGDIHQRLLPKIRSRNRNRLMKSRYSARAPITEAESLFSPATWPFLMRWTSHAVRPVKMTTPRTR